MWVLTPKSWSRSVAAESPASPLPSVGLLLWPLLSSSPRLKSLFYITYRIQIFLTCRDLSLQLAKEWPLFSLWLGVVCRSAPGLHCRGGPGELARHSIPDASSHTAFSFFSKKCQKKLGRRQRVRKVTQEGKEEMVEKIVPRRQRKGNRSTKLFWDNWVSLILWRRIDPRCWRLPVLGSRVKNPSPSSLLHVHGGVTPSISSLWESA